MMDVINFKRSESEASDDLLAMLAGHVFHVAKLAYLPAILASRKIRPNEGRSLPTTFGYLENGFFRNRGCVSVFDYRGEATEQIQEYRGRCSPLQAASPDMGGIAIFILRPEAYDSLIPWTRWRDEGAHSEMVVPYVEAGHPGNIPITFVARIVTLELVEDPASIAAIYRRARQRRLAKPDQGEAM